MRTCGFENQINLYLDGELSGGKLRAFEAHLEDCPECRGEVEQYRGLLNELHGLPELEVPPVLSARLHDALAKETEKGDGRVKRKFNPWALSAVAAAAVILIGGVALIGTGALHGASNYDLAGQNYIQGAAATAAPALRASVAQSMNGSAGKGLSAPMPEPEAAPTAASAAKAPDMTVEKPPASYSGFTANETTNGADAGATNPQQQVNGRKIIYTAYLVVETREYDKCIGTVESLYAKYGGYKANSQENGVPDLSGGASARNSVFSIRIPLEKYDAAVGDLKAMGNLLSCNEGTQDVSRQYVDTEARNKTLRAERDKLYDLMAKAESMESIIALQSRISELTAEIEQETAQLNFWDDQVSYSTITVEIREIVTPKSVKPVDPDLGTRANGALNTTLNNMKKSLEDFAVGFVGFVPWLAVIVAVAAVVLAVVIPATAKARRAARKKAAESTKKEE